MAGKRVLVIGSTGFAGRHFVAAAGAAGFDVETAARIPGAADHEVDLLDPASIASALSESRLDTVVNLAGAASVGRSWADPGAAFEINASGVLNLLDAVAEIIPEAHVVCVSSGEVYGAVGEVELPLTEQHPARPANPYATSKAAMELICDQYARTAGIRIAIMRSFNHLGPGQSDAFAASSFARQIAVAECEERDRVELRTGDLSPERDFSDVRDVVRAYVLAVERGLSGIYNVSSGRAVKLEDLVAELAAQAQLEVDVEVDDSRLRPAEAPRVFGAFDRLRDATGWRPEIPLDRTLGDLLEWWRGEPAQ